MAWIEAVLLPLLNRMFPGGISITWTGAIVNLWHEDGTLDAALGAMLTDREEYHKMLNKRNPRLRPGKGKNLFPLSILT